MTPPDNASKTTGDTSDPNAFIPINLSAQAYQRVAAVIPRLLATASLDGAFTSVSDAWPSYTNMATRTLLGWGWLRAVQSEERATVSRDWRTSAESGQFASREVCLLEGRTAQARTWLVHGTLERDPEGTPLQWLFSFTDIEAQKQVQKRVREKEERLRLVLDRTPILILSTDAAGIVTNVSGLGLSILGRSREDFLGRFVGETVKVYPEVHAALLAALAGTPREADVRLRGRDWQMNLVPNRDSAGQPAGITAMFIDITERREALNLAVSERAAREASRAKGMFLANMSHEVRTPLAGILGVAELLADMPLDEQQQRYLNMIRESGVGLLNVINDILSFSQSQQSARPRSRVVYSPAKILQTQMDMMRSPATHKGVRLTARIDADVPTRVYGDSGRVAQVLLNLLSNAIKFAHNGRVELGVSREGTERIRFYVKDSGIGLSAETQQRLFEPYVQADATTAQTYGGTGLGLAISRDLIRDMGGEIRVESSLGDGATFHVTLPLQDASYEGERSTAQTDADAKATEGTQSVKAGTGAVGAEAMASSLQTAAADGAQSLQAGTGALGAEATATPLQTGTADGGQNVQTGIGAVDAEPMATPLQTRAASGPPAEMSQPQILVVEDNKTNQLLMQAHLKKLGFTCQLANQGLEALEALTAREFALILMDCQMPEMDGYAATRAIRAQESGTHKHVPIVAVTANVMAEDQALCVAAGMDGYLAKPFNREELKQLLARWLPNGASPTT